MPVDLPTRAAPRRIRLPSLAVVGLIGLIGAGGAVSAGTGTGGASAGGAAAAAGPLNVGGTAPWSSGHLKVSIERNEHGTLTVSRLIQAGDLDCKEVIFSVDKVVKEKTARAFYTTIVCRDGEFWRWASAEPATERWGSLQ